MWFSAGPEDTVKNRRVHAGFALGGFESGT